MWCETVGWDNPTGAVRSQMQISQINPMAVRAMAEVGIDITAERPKVLTTDAVRRVRDQIRSRIEHLLGELLAAT